MATATMTREQIDAVMAKLDGLDIIGDDEMLVLRAAVRLAADTAPAPGVERKATGRFGDNGVDVGSF
jgi:hypothetical protein